MKHRIFSAFLPLSLLFAMAAPVLAADEPEPAPAPEYRLASVDKNGLTYTFSYDNGGYLPTGIISSDGGYEAVFEYDEAGRMIHKTVSDNGDTTDDTYTYDADGNLLKDEYTDSYSDGTTAEGWDAYTYDESGNCLREETNYSYNGGTSIYVIENTYDEAGRIISMNSTQNGNFSTGCQYAYEEADHSSSAEITYSDGTVDTRVSTYDDAGNKLSETHSESGEVYYEANFTYDDAGRMSTQAIHNANAGADISVRYIYTPPLTIELEKNTGYGDRVTCWLRDDAGETVFSSSSQSSAEPQLTYDDNGYVTELDYGDGSLAFTYEPVA